MTRTWTVGDLKPDLRVKLTNRDGDFNAEDADQVWLVAAYPDGSLAFNKQADTVTYTPPSGDVHGYSEVTMMWEPDETAVAAELDMVVRCIWPGGKPQTVPIDRGPEILVPKAAA